jgi:hypothetical protein
MNYRRMFKRNVLPYLVSSQIWLNIFVDYLPFWLHHKIDPKKKKKKHSHCGLFEKETQLVELV